MVSSEDEEVERQHEDDEAVEQRAEHREPDARARRRRGSPTKSPPVT